MYVPARSWASVNDTPAAKILTRTSPGRGRGSLLLHHPQDLGPAEVIDDDALHPLLCWRTHGSSFGLRWLRGARSWDLDLADAALRLYARRRRPAAPGARPPRYWPRLSTRSRDRRSGTRRAWLGGEVGSRGPLKEAKTTAALARLVSVLEQVTGHGWSLPSPVSRRSGSPGRRGRQGRPDQAHARGGGTGGGAHRSMRCLYRGSASITLRGTLVGMTLASRRLAAARRARYSSSRRSRPRYSTSMWRS
jgi:hypothetical protein